MGNILKNAGGGSPPPALEPVSKSTRTSTSYGGRSSDLKGPWFKPRNAKEFASQANRVATLILTGGIDLDVARVYSAVARTVSQSMSTEVQRARMAREVPDLGFDEISD